MSEILQNPKFLESQPAAWKASDSETFWVLDVPTELSVDRTLKEKLKYDLKFIF